MIFLKNTLSADLVSKDYSTIIDSLDDLIRHKDILPILTYEDPLSELVKKELNPTYKELHQQIKRVSKEMKREDLRWVRMENFGKLINFAGSNKSAIIGPGVQVALITRTLCINDPEKTFWLATGHISDFIIAFAYSLKMNSVKRTFLDKRFVFFNDLWLIFNQL